MKPLDLRCLPFMSFPSFTGAVIKVMSSLMMRRQERLEIGEQVLQFKC